ncbi:MAG: FG-GAP repeat protein [Planctomycetota bacterium]
MDPSDPALALALLALLAAPVVAQCQEAELLGPGDASANYALGLAIEGDVLVLGDPGPDAPFGGPLFSGEVEVYRHGLGGWVAAETLLAPITGVLGFGSGVAFDEGRLLVGASGFAFVFEDSPAGFVQVDTIPSPGGYFFGLRAALDGTTAAITGAGLPGAGGGSIHFFEEDPTQGWGWEGTFYGGRDLDFGESVAVDGDYAAAGTPVIGECCVFERSGSTWTQVAILSEHGAPSFGRDVALHGDTLVVGAPGSLLAGENPGAVFVYERIDGTWIQTGRIDPPVPTEGWFGRSVDFDGELVAVGDPWPFERGTVFFYRRVQGDFELVATLNATNDDVEGLGKSVALDGERVVAASYISDHTVVFRQPAVLNGAPTSISVAAGGVQSFELSSCTGFAGQAYLVLGSQSGTSPGVSAFGLTLPLNPDPYFLVTLNGSSASPLAGSFGSIDAAGGAAASFVLPPGSDAALVGLVLHHAFALLSATGAELIAVSNAEPLALLP